MLSVCVAIACSEECGLPASLPTPHRRRLLREDGGHCSPPPRAGPGRAPAGRAPGRAPACPAPRPLDERGLVARRLEDLGRVAMLGGRGGEPGIITEAAAAAAATAADVGVATAVGVAGCYAACSSQCSVRNA